MQQTRHAATHTNREENTPMATVYDLITDRILEKLQYDNVPWQKPWNVQAGIPRNLLSQKKYRGINVWVLGSMGSRQTHFKGLETRGVARDRESATRPV